MFDFAAIKYIKTLNYSSREPNVKLSVWTTLWSLYQFVDMFDTVTVDGDGKREFYKKLQCFKLER